MKRFATAVAVCALLSGCAGLADIQAGKPISQEDVAKDQAMTNYLLSSAGCLSATAGAIAAPIVTIEGDEKGNQVLTAADASGAALCKLVVPPAALPAPAPANAAPATVPAAAAPVS